MPTKYQSPAGERSPTMMLEPAPTPDNTTSPGRIDYYMGKVAGSKRKSDTEKPLSPSQNSPEHQKHRVKSPESSPAAESIPPAPDPSIITPQRDKKKEMTTKRTKKSKKKKDRKARKKKNKEKTESQVPHRGTEEKIDPPQAATRRKG